jgi:hypothetical protein
MFIEQWVLGKLMKLKARQARIDCAERTGKGDHWRLRGRETGLIAS